ncbi:hypothetical protein RCL1_001789 [Eukaryota sp. TZLM3-RCL]
MQRQLSQHAVSLSVSASRLPSQAVKAVTDLSDFFAKTSVETPSYLLPDIFRHLNDSWSCVSRTSYLHNWSSPLFSSNLTCFDLALPCFKVLDSRRKSCSITKQPFLASRDLRTVDFSSFFSCCLSFVLHVNSEYFLQILDEIIALKLVDPVLSDSNYFVFFNSRISTFPFISKYIPISLKKNETPTNSPFASNNSPKFSPTATSSPTRVSPRNSSFIDRCSTPSDSPFRQSFGTINRTRRNSVGSPSGPSLASLTSDLIDLAKSSDDVSTVNYESNLTGLLGKVINVIGNQSEVDPIILEPTFSIIKRLIESNVTSSIIFQQFSRLLSFPVDSNCIVDFLDESLINQIFELPSLFTKLGKILFKNFEHQSFFDCLSFISSLLQFLPFVTLQFVSDWFELLFMVKNQSNFDCRESTSENFNLILTNFSTFLLSPIKVSDDVISLSFSSIIDLLSMFNLLNNSEIFKVFCSSLLPSHPTTERLLLTFFLDHVIQSFSNISSLNFNQIRGIFSFNNWISTEYFTDLILLLFYKFKMTSSVVIQTINHFFELFSSFPSVYSNQISTLKAVSIILIDHNFDLFDRLSLTSLREFFVEFFIPIALETYKSSKTLKSIKISSKDDVMSSSVDDLVISLTNHFGLNLIGTSLSMIDLISRLLISSIPETVKSIILLKYHNYVSLSQFLNLFSKSLENSPLFERNSRHLYRNSLTFDQSLIYSNYFSTFSKLISLFEATLLLTDADDVAGHVMNDCPSFFSLINQIYSDLPVVGLSSDSSFLTATCDLIHLLISFVDIYLLKKRRLGDLFSGQVCDLITYLLSFPCQSFHNQIDRRLHRHVALFENSFDDVIQSFGQSNSSSVSFLLSRCPFILPLSFRYKIFKELVNFSDSSKDTLIISRDSPCESLYNLFTNRSCLVLKSSNMRISFENEKGIDVKGLRTECFSLVSKQLFHDGVGKVFELENTISQFCKNPEPSWLNFTGLFLAKSMLHCLVVCANLSPLIWRCLAGVKVSPLEILIFDPLFSSSINSILEDSNPLGLYFVSFDGEELCPNGELTPVTRLNRFGYVSKLLEHVLGKSFKQPSAIVQHGFNSLISSRVTSLFSYKELELLCCGSDTVDVEELIEGLVIKGGTTESLTIQHLFDELRDATSDDVALFLEFITGSPRMPLGTTFECPITIHLVESSDRLPTSSTCFNTLKLPEYDDVSVLKNKLWAAVYSDRSFAFD